MKLSKIIYDVKESLNEFTTDSKISNRYIIHLINTGRSKYLSQLLNRGNSFIDYSLIQSYCEDLIKVDASECSVDIGCEYLLRSKNKLSSLLDLEYKSAITSIKLPGKLSSKLTLVDLNRVEYIKDSPYNKSVYAFLDYNNYLYLYSNNEMFKILEKIIISGVFDDPIEVYEQGDSCEDNKPLNILEMDYPLQSKYVDLIVQEISQKLGAKKSIPFDNANDDNDIILRNEKNS